MATVTGFRTPEEAALELELPLLGHLSAGPEVDGPVAAAWPAVEGIRRDVERICDRLLESPLLADGSVGVLGDVSSSTRAEVSAALAAGLASERTTVLIDADLRAAHLSFDDRRRAQEGLVDVLRYGVRSPRVVSPTLTPGLALLPVGSRTLDLEGTYGAESVPGLFAELARSGEVLFVNGPAPGDVDAAEPLLAHVEGWILVHELGASDPERTRALRDRCGKTRCVGVLVLTPSTRAGRAGALTEDEVEEEAAVAPASPAVPVPPLPAVPAAEAALPASPAPVVPAVAEPLREAADDLPRAEAPAPARAAAPAAWEPAGDSEARPRSNAPWVLGGVAVAAVVLAVMFWPRAATPPETPPAMTAPPAAPVLGDEPATIAPAVDEEPAALAPVVDEEPAAIAPVVDEEPAATASAPDEAVVVSPGGADAAAPPAGQSPATEPGPGAGEPVAETPVPVSADAPPATAAGTSAPATGSSTGSAAATGTPAAVAAGTVFGVHLESVKSEDGAAKEAATLTAQGTPAFIHRTDIPDKGTWWRVYAGPFATRAEAEQAAARIRAGGREYAQVHRLERGETGR